MKHKLTYTIAVIVAFVGLLFVSNVWAIKFDQQHSKWNSILSKHVMDFGSYSQVDYNAIKQNPTSLNQYLSTISAVAQQQYNSWARNEQLAFLINAYNAFTVKLIIDNYPVDSIKDIGSFFTGTWKIKFFTIFSEKQNLDYIEHTLIRGNPKFNEPRIHFAVVCASIGCPKLQNQAFTAENIEAMLEKGTVEFLQDSSRNRYNINAKELQLSKIFKWYGDDFKKKFNSVEQFVAKYISNDPAAQSSISNKDVGIGYLDYNWALNDAK